MSDGHFDEMVLVRTTAGQSRVWDDDALEIDRPSLRLLRLVNGYTPLGELARRLGSDEAWDELARELLGQRLVAPATVH